VGEDLLGDAAVGRILRESGTEAWSVEDVEKDEVSIAVTLGTVSGEYERRERFLVAKNEEMVGPKDGGGEQLTRRAQRLIHGSTTRLGCLFHGIVTPRLLSEPDCRNVPVIVAKLKVVADNSLPEMNHERTRS